MIRIHQVKLPVGHTQEELKKKAAKLLGCDPGVIKKLTIVKRSVDARKKAEHQIFYSYILDLEIPGEARVLKRAGKVQASLTAKESYQAPAPGREPLKERPVIIGTGPAGLFAGYLLAREGYRPLLLERGADVDSRTEAVSRYWAGQAPLDLRSNVQFGEGGAGTFSDGKLNTLVKDPGYRGRFALETFVSFGADPDILYEQKPHIGTDVLRKVVKGMREAILSMGGEVRFETKMTEIRTEKGEIRAVCTEAGEEIPVQVLILAIGHSARDTFRMLAAREIPMSAKAFAVGLRIQHSQDRINRSQYGPDAPGELGAAAYKLTAKSSSGRGVYSFCMCPGGYVVDASSEAGRIAVNGMSYHDRASGNANSALIVTVTPEDYPETGPLGGIAFQEQLEEKAWIAGGGKVPVQLYGDFCADRTSQSYGSVQPRFQGQTAFANLRRVLPEELSAAFMEGMESFDHRIPGFAQADAILAGVESRTSSPVRIERDDSLQSPVRGIYPCGEGAGYAGGITSAAMDGIRVAEKVISLYAPIKPGIPV